jgi:hypothetical protein
MVPIYLLPIMASRPVTGQRACYHGSAIRCRCAKSGERLSYGGMVARLALLDGCTGMHHLARRLRLAVATARSRDPLLSDNEIVSSTERR